VPEPQLELLLAEMSQKYISDGVSEFAKAWNALREDILRVAVKDMLLPQVGWGEGQGGRCRL
jgi:hypothetical protein